jgi:oligoendopeptidase F
MAATLEDVAWDLDPLVDGEGEAGADRQLAEAQERAAMFAERHQGKVAELDGRGLAEAVA